VLCAEIWGKLITRQARRFKPLQGRNICCCRRSMVSRQGRQELHDVSGRLCHLICEDNLSPRLLADDTGEFGTLPQDLLQHTDTFGVRSQATHVNKPPCLSLSCVAKDHLRLPAPGRDERTSETPGQGVDEAGAQARQQAIGLGNSNRRVGRRTRGDVREKCPSDSEEVI